LPAPEVETPVSRGAAFPVPNRPEERERVAKKKSRKKTRPPGYDPNEARRQRLEARRKAREEEVRKKVQAQRRERWIRRGALLLLFAGVFWFVFMRGGARPDAIAGNDLDLFSETVSQPSHVSGTVNYAMTPPVVGQHSAQSIPCGTYARTPPNEQFVHALEHGTVGILYNPGEVPVEDIASIEELVGEYPSHVLSAPYPNMEESPIAVTSWGEMMRLNSWDADATTEYIREFRNTGPEKQPCPMNSTDSFEPQPEETPGAEETPGTEETPDDGEAEEDGGNNGGGGNG
jgi:hypothetical protein